MAQLVHISSTGALVVFSPAAVTPAQEAARYVLYAVALWALAITLLWAIRTADLPQSL